MGAFDGELERMRPFDHVIALLSAEAGLQVWAR